VTVTIPVPPLKKVTVTFFHLFGDLIKYAIKRYSITYAKTRIAQNNNHHAALLRHFFVFGVGSIFEGRGVYAERRGLCGLG
jgi:hypothetical protein